MRKIMDGRRGMEGIGGEGGDSSFFFQAAFAFASGSMRSAAPDGSGPGAARPPSRNG